MLAVHHIYIFLLFSKEGLVGFSSQSWGAVCLVPVLELLEPNTELVLSRHYKVIAKLPSSEFQKICRDLKDPRSQGQRRMTVQEPHYTDRGLSRNGQEVAVKSSQQLVHPIPLLLLACHPSRFQLFCSVQGVWGNSAAERQQGGPEIPGEGRHR